MDFIHQLVSDINGLLWGWPMIILLFGTHVFLTLRLKIPQRKMFKSIRLSLAKDKGSEGDVSQFAALATSLAATIGTGNIVGVATAVSLGGPGAVLWCWLAGLFGIATKYGEGLLAIKYRVKTKDGRMWGGPMYALERGLGMKWLAVLFCVFAAIATLGIGNSVQANALSENITYICSGFSNPHDTKLVVGFFLSALVGFVIIGGVKTIARWCSVLVPFMAILYVIGCLYILAVNSPYLIDAVKLICREAFSLKAVGGGTTGTVMMAASRYGIARGLFSNESGMGSAPIVAAAAKTRNPVRQALVSSTGTFWDTVVICGITGLVIVSSILAYPELKDVDCGALTSEAFSKIPYIGTPFLTFGILTFAFSTIIGWSYYGERCMEYLAGRRSIIFYRIIYILLVFAGSSISLNLAWSVSDIMNALMAIPNLVSLLLLSGVIAKETQYYLWEDHLDENTEPE